MLKELYRKLTVRNKDIEEAMVFIDLAEKTYNLMKKSENERIKEEYKKLAKKYMDAAARKLKFKDSDELLQYIYKH